jgi:hypothetical protein
VTGVAGILLPELNFFFRNLFDRIENGAIIGVCRALLRFLAVPIARFWHWQGIFVMTVLPATLGSAAGSGVIPNAFWQGIPGTSFPALAISTQPID